jgi:hypothetical protein
MPDPAWLKRLHIQSHGGLCYLQRAAVLRLSTTVTPKFSLYITFPPIFLPIFSSLAAVPLKYSPIPHYNYKISFSISTINFLSTNNYLWTHNTVFRVMNSDTLDPGEREGGRSVGAL